MILICEFNAKWETFFLSTGILNWCIRFFDFVQTRSVNISSATLFGTQSRKNYKNFRRSRFAWWWGWRNGCAYWRSKSRKGMRWKKWSSRNDKWIEKNQLNLTILRVSKFELHHVWRDSQVWIFFYQICFYCCTF